MFGGGWVAEGLSQRRVIHDEANTVQPIFQGIQTSYICKSYENSEEAAALLAGGQLGNGDGETLRCISKVYRVELVRALWEPRVTWTGHSPDSSDHRNVP